METLARAKITVETTVNAPVEMTWELWTDPRHVVHWNFASIDWHTTYSENDLKVGGRFLSRMEARNGSSGFDFSGEYNSIELYKHIDYTMTDGRRVRVNFHQKGLGTRITETFEAETTNPVEFQQEGWQAILDNFKHYVESPFREEIISFEIEIDNSVEEVFNTMIDEKTYREWTSVFNEFSTFRGSWKKGSKILFLGEEKDGIEGMVSRIKEFIPHKFISIEHLGYIKKGVEITCGPEVDNWQGALENYTFKTVLGKTQVIVDIDMIEGMKPYLTGFWPEALRKLKEICERE
jgi:uncharacterized protein YndB with AHSA1/START domain